MYSIYTVLVNKKNLNSGRKRQAVNFLFLGEIDRTVRNFAAFHGQIEFDRTHVLSCDVK